MNRDCSKSSKPVIYVDADACPVRRETVDVATRFGAKTVLVCDGGIRPPRDPMVQLVVVPGGPDAADHWIVEHVRKHDIVVTADIELAFNCLEKHARVLSHDGSLFTARNIGMKLSMRDLNRHLRETGVQKDGGQPFSLRDRSAFLQQLDRLMTARSSH